LRFRDRPAPTIVVTGRGEEAVNTVSPPPACVESPYRLTSCVERIELPEATASAVNRRSLLVGPTSLLNSLEIHCSMLAAGQRAHAPHRHSEESLLLGFDGAFEVLASECPGFEDPRVYPVSRGSLIYQPSYEQHCVGNSGEAAASYLVLAWRGPALETDDPAPATVIAAEPSRPEDTQSFRRDVLFERPTAYLEKLHVHMSTLQPGAGYAPHVDDYDVVIVLLSGTVETLGRIVTARSLIYYAAGEPHGLRNVGHDVARYAVVEFHAPRRRTRNRDTFPLIVAASGPQRAKRRVEEFRTFWSGPPLSAYEKLGLASLTARGQRVLLYSYDRALRVPDGVELVDANEILPADRVHEIKLTNGETAPTIHANLFRYEALRRLGGWYVDLDVVLIADEPPAVESYIGREDERLVNNAILRFTPDAPLMTAAVEAARGLMTSTEIGASGPKLMTRLIGEMKLEDLVVPRLAAYPVRSTEVLQLFLPEHREELETRIAGADFLHLWNQIWRRVRIPKDLGPPEGSFLDGLFRSFGFRFAPGGRMQAEAVRSWFREYFVLLEAKAASGGVAAMAGLAHALAVAKA
jgi:quercetin dioxygenase-like cupin family protein